MSSYLYICILFAKSKQGAHTYKQCHCYIVLIACLACIGMLHCETSLALSESLALARTRAHEAKLRLARYVRAANSRETCCLSCTHMTPRWIIISSFVAAVRMVST